MSVVLAKENNPLFHHHTSQPLALIEGRGYAQRTGVTERAAVGGERVGRPSGVVDVALSVHWLRLAVVCGGVWRGRVRVHDGRAFLEICHSLLVVVGVVGVGGRGGR